MIMPTKHKLSIALTASLLFTTGCSGARLKNLIGRNDYQTLEELEREDSSYADLYDDADEKDSRFVSQTREIDEPVDPLDDLEDEQPRSRFGFGRLFGRDKDDDCGCAKYACSSSRLSNPHSTSTSSRAAAMPSTD